jgi:hypothetical protein
MRAPQVSRDLDNDTNTIIPEKGKIGDRCRLVSSIGCAARAKKKKTPPGGLLVRVAF